MDCRGLLTTGSQIQKSLRPGVSPNSDLSATWWKQRMLSTLLWRCVELTIPQKNWSSNNGYELVDHG